MKKILNELNKFKKEFDIILEKKFPKKIDYKFIEDIFGKTEYEYDAEAFENAIIKPCWDLLDRGGKRWRPFLFVKTYEALGGKKEDVLDLSIIPELMHNGSLIIDDIEDKSELRRGKPCIHRIYGTDIAINAGNFLYFYPFNILIKNKFLDANIKKELYEMILNEMSKLHLGQGTDIYWHKKEVLKIPTVKQYLEMCSNKTGGLSRIAVKMAGIIAKKDKETIVKLGKFGESIGIAFQIQDDIINLKSKEFQKLKGFGEDITEGKMTLMVIYTLENADEKDKKKLIEILKEKTTDPEKIKTAIEIMEKYNSFEYSKKLARNILEDAWNKIKNIFINNEAKQTLEEFVYFVIEREI